MHLPLLQIAPPLTGTAQAVPQAPQLATLALRSTHADEHAVVPDGQTLTHTPPEQASVFAQAMLQPPQLLGSVRGSMQAFPQRAKPVWHPKLQRPPLQTGIPNAGTSHVRLQVPQFCASIVTSTHWPLQSVRPASQLDWHAPPVHVAVPFAGAVHAWSQAPQSATLLASSTHAPPHATSGLGQALTHAPLAQTWPTEQALAQAPQFAESASKFTQAPLQSEKPSLQTLAQVPAWHTA